MVELMTLEEIADYLRVTEKTIYRLLKQGNIPAMRVGRVWRFDREKIDTWLRQSSVGASIRVLIIDDEPIIHELMKETLEEFGHKVSSALTGELGLEMVKKAEFDMIFLDLKLPDINGNDVFREIRKVKPDVPVTIITGYPDTNMMAQALAEGPFGVMKKPFSESDILKAIHMVMPISRMKE